MMDVHMHNPARPKHVKPAVVQHGVAHGTPAFRQIHALAMGGSAAAGGRRRKKKSLTLSRARSFLKRAGKAVARAQKFERTLSALIPGTSG